MLRAFNNILVVVKQTPYESYLQLKAQGKAPVALRWERLKNRYAVHKKCVEDVTGLLEKVGVKYNVIGREELHRGSLQDKDLVIAVGGDGTVLNTSSFIDDSLPVLGVNSDPTKPEEQGVTNVKDERRSRGALCAASALDVHQYLPKVLYGEVSPGLRSRIQCIVRSTYTETRLPPALNDLLISHPIPAAVSRFRLTLCQGAAEPSFKPVPKYEEMFSFNVWSSGIWVATATGSTAAIHAAGGHVMSLRSENLQYMVREHLIEGNNTHHHKAGYGEIRINEMLHLRWNSQYGSVFVDGSHMKHDLELGDEIKIDGRAPHLRIYDPVVTRPIESK
jgi:NAD+ kinase